MATADCPVNQEVLGAVIEGGVAGSLFDPVQIFGAATKMPVEAPIFLPLAFQVMTEQPPQPTQIKFGAVIDPLLRLVKPIKLDVSSGEEAEVVVSWAEINEYGCGPTTGDALVDFGQSLRALYHELHAPDIQLGPDLVKVKATLDEFIVRRG